MAVKVAITKTAIVAGIMDRKQARIHQVEEFQFRRRIAIGVALIFAGARDRRGGIGRREERAIEPEQVAFRGVAAQVRIGHP